MFFLLRVPPHLRVPVVYLLCDLPTDNSKHKKKKQIAYTSHLMTLHQLRRLRFHILWSSRNRLANGQESLQRHGVLCTSRLMIHCFTIPSMQILALFILGICIGSPFISMKSSAILQTVIGRWSCIAGLTHGAVRMLPA